MQPRSDVDQIKALLQARIVDLVHKLAPGGEIKGNYWLSRSPGRNDRHAGSFWVTLRHTSKGPPGVWKDEGTGDKGDVFGLTRGLTRAFPTQGKNSALTESTIVGVSVGRALAGGRPVAFIQFADFVPLEQEPQSSIDYRNHLNSEGSPSETVAADYVWQPGTELSRKAVNF